MYKEWFIDHQALNNCSNPCYLIATQIFKSREEIYEYKNLTKLKIYFDEGIKHTKAYYLYDGMSLIAEVGGFIGLIKLLNTFLRMFVNKIEKIVNIFEIGVKQVDY